MDSMGPTEKTHIVGDNQTMHTPALASSHMNTADTAGLVDNTDGEAGDFDADKQAAKPEERSGITGASFNTANSILGSGIIGLPYAMKQAGLPFGIILLVITATVTDYSMVLLIKGGELSGTNTYQDVVQSAFGIPGYYLLTAIQFVYPFVAMIGYNVIIGDTITKVFVRVFSVEHVLANRYFIISIITVMVSLPLSLYRNVTKLVKVAVISLILLVVIMLVVIIRLGTYDVPDTPNPWQFGKIHFTESIGIMAFAFVCHHNSFLIFSSLETPTTVTWSKVTHLAVLIAFLACALVGICGYATFTGFTQGDLLENYCYSDDLANMARILFAITIICTYPLECFVCREVLEHLAVRHAWVSSEPQPFTRHMILTLIIVGLTLAFSMSTSCLGIVLSLNGILCAIPLVFILPTACYVRLAEGRWFAKHKIPSLLIGTLGVIVTVFGFVTLFIDTSLSKCQDPGALPYCTKDQAIINSSMPIPPTAEPSFVSTISPFP
ncbi:putative sodium-coupled neutral amino acid transporter 11 isoform X2 [Amphiura filiformis]|uniref:putative sodium-coupled neutral amino acid transporter 11 isoform X2 n=1 Tax=Amphiura filiformis TaxID=82378 RepID=UPI003B21AA59